MSGDLSEGFQRPGNGGSGGLFAKVALLSTLLFRTGVGLLVGSESDDDGGWRGSLPIGAPDLGAVAGAAGPAPLVFAATAGRT